MNGFRTPEIPRDQWTLWANCERLRERMVTDPCRAIYKRLKRTVEPRIDHIKHNVGKRHVLEKITTEWLMAPAAMKAGNHAALWGGAGGNTMRSDAAAARPMPIMPPETHAMARPRLNLKKGWGEPNKMKTQLSLGSTKFTRLQKYADSLVRRRARCKMASPQLRKPTAC